MGRPAYARESTVRSFGSLDRAPCCPIRFLNSTDNTTRLLSLDSPTPRARTYADRLSKNSREVTLVAALGLFRRLAVGRSEAQDPEAEFGHLLGAQLSRAHVATPIGAFPVLRADSSFPRLRS